LETGAEGATFGIVGAVDELWDAGLDDGAGAHGAGLEGDIESGVNKAVVAENACGFAQDDDFSVRGGIIVANGAIAGAREVRIIVNQHSADGDFTGHGGSASLLQSKAHEMEIVGHGKVRIARQERATTRREGRECRRLRTRRWGGARQESDRSCGPAF
jgi:hypothetical protein